jgi:hypothetical protein
MTYGERSSDQARDGITLSTEILPVWNIVATVMMLSASIVTLLVFTADSGRYIPTGSVMGFQGPSYFYITGIWGLVVSICWGFSTAGKLKRLSISTREDGALLVRERVIGGSRELAIPAGDLKAIVFKRHPSAGHVAWLVIAIGWLAFILQFAVPNFQLPFAGVPVAGTTLLVFGVCVTWTAVIGVTRPGFHVVIIDAAASLVIKLPGVTSAVTLADRIAMALEKPFKMHPGVLPWPGSEVKSNAWYRTLLLGATGFLILGVVNVALLLAGSSLPLLNQGSAWVMVISGCLGMIACKNRGNALSLHTRVASQDSAAWVGHCTGPRLWMVVIGAIECVILWYFVGLRMRFDVTLLDVGASKILALGVISFLYTCWCIFTSLETSNSLLVNLGDVYSASVRTFSLAIFPSSKNRHHEKTSKLLVALAMLLLFGAVTLIPFITGHFI